VSRLGQDTGARLVAAFDFLAVLVGRDWVTTREIADALGCHRRTVRRYALAAEMVGLVEYRPGKQYQRGAEDRSAVRLVSGRMRRAA
jgi:DNA-binding IclR family transcriptional regulator